MVLDLKYQALPGLLRVDVAGDATLSDVIALIDQVGLETKRTGQRHVLVNLLAVKEVLKFTDHYSVGEHAARTLSHLQKLASVVPADRRTQTSEKVANAQGMRLRVFVSVADAMAWLNAAQL